MLAAPYNSLEAFMKKLIEHGFANLLWDTLYKAGVPAAIKPGATVYSRTSWGIRSSKINHFELTAENIYACDEYGDIIGSIDELFTTEEEAQAVN